MKKATQHPPKNQTRMNRNSKGKFISSNPTQRSPLMENSKSLKPEIPHPDAQKIKDDILLQEKIYAAASDILNILEKHGVYKHSKYVFEIINQSKIACYL